MGLLDSLDDPDKQALLAMGLGLLAPKQQKTGFLGDVGQSGLLGLQTLGAAKQQERQNRQSDLQQLSGAYNLLKQQEFGKMLAAKQNGTPYSPNPMLPQMEARLGQLAGLDNLSGRFGLSATSAPPAPAQAAPAPSMPPPGMAPPSQSPMADSNYQPPMIRQPQAPQPQVSQPQGMGNLGAPAGGVPMEAWLAQDPTGASYMKQLAEDNKPIALRQGDLTQRQPDGTYKSVFQQPMSVPGVLPTRDASGQVTSFRQGPGFKEAAADIKGAEAGATQTAKQGATYGDFPIGNNQTRHMTNAQYEAMLAGQAASRLSGGQVIPQAVLDASRRGQTFNATQTPDGNVQFQPPSASQVARVTPIQPSPFPGSMGGLGVTASPVAMAGAVADAQAAAKNRQGVMTEDYKALANQSTIAQTAISRLQTIKQLGPQAITGAQSDTLDFLNGLLALGGVPAAKNAKEASDLLDKQAANIAIVIGAGSNGTDALRALAQIANPNRHMQDSALPKAADSVIAPLQMGLSKMQILTPHFIKGDAGNYLTQKQQFEQSADPRLWELQSLPPEDQKAYVSAMSSADAKQLLQKRAAMKKFGVLQ